MSLLGAQLTDLDDLASQLTTTSGDITGVQGDSTTATNTVVADVRASATDALTRITTLMDDLRSTVEAAAAKANAAEWTGQNQARFIEGYGNFQAAVGQAELATKDTFSNFDQAINQMGEELEAYQATLSSALSEASASTDSMSTAVAAQRDNLDAVMNTGLN